MKKYSAAVITVSDSGFAGEREDKSGEVIRALLSSAGYEIDSKVIVPDDVERIQSAILDCCERDVNFVVTTGGTGFSKRDVTPEATLKIIEREARGISEAIRSNGLKYTDRAMLSRGVCGIRGNTLILNLPGSPKAVEEDLSYVLGAVGHGLEILDGSAHDCARKDTSSSGDIK